MPLITLVLIRPAFITENLAIRNILKDCGAFDIFASQAGISVDSLLQDWRQPKHGPYIPLHVDKYHHDHHFGPTLTIKGSTGEPVDLTLPWA
jgi:hypothetical protein